MTDLEKQLLSAVWKAWRELNTIRARDGVPYKYDGLRSDVSEDYFSSVVDECSFAIEAATGAPTTPWFPAALGGPSDVMEFNEGDSAAFMEHLLKRAAQ